MARIGHSSYEAAIRYQHVVAERDAAIADALEGLGNVRPLMAKPKRNRSGTDVARRKPKAKSRSGGRCLTGTDRWSGRRDLNPRPPAPKAGALPNCATSRR